MAPASSVCLGRVLLRAHRGPEPGGGLAGHQIAALPGKGVTAELVILVCAGGDYQVWDMTRSRAGLCADVADKVSVPAVTTRTPGAGGEKGDVSCQARS
jgi:hypothetical protein